MRPGPKKQVPPGVTAARRLRFPLRSLVRIEYLMLPLLLLGACGALSADGPRWTDRAPLNTDTTFVDPSLAVWQWRSYLWLAFLCNLPVLAGLVYAFEQERADYSNLLYIYLVMLVAAILSVLLCRYIGALSLIPLLVLEILLLARFCMNSVKAAVFVALLYHIFQVIYIVVYRAIATRLA